MSIEDEAMKIAVHTTDAKGQSTIDRRVLVTDSLQRLMRGDVNMPKTQMVHFGAVVMEMLDECEPKQKVAVNVPDECCGMRGPHCRFACIRGH